jgi:hypothetical protein
MLLEPVVLIIELLLYSKESGYCPFPPFLLATLKILLIEIFLAGLFSAFSFVMFYVKFKASNVVSSSLFFMTCLLPVFINFIGPLEGIEDF